MEAFQLESPVAPSAAAPKSRHADHERVEATAQRLGNAQFRRDYGLTYAYLSGAMYRGIASKEMVVAMGRAGMLGFLGTGGMSIAQIRADIVHILSTGLKTTWSVGADTVFVAAGLLLFVSVAGKLLGIWLAGRALGWQRGDAALIGWLLQTKGLIELIFANILLDKQIITNQTFTAMLLMAVVSNMLSLPMVRNSRLLGAHGPHGVTSTQRDTEAALQTRALRD